MTTATDCGLEMRDGLCILTSGHRGRHTTVGFYCDVCGKMRRGNPIPIMQLMADGYREHVADMCFLCSRGITPTRGERE